ncbi:MAG: hypothetical protein PHP08_00380 [Candidatus Dojkabacteria bacterium]|nr:hypothetical protein [Candidatus Dojkabacteria bacterium]
MAEYRERIRYTEMAKDMAVIGGGFIVSGFSGRYVEQQIKPNLPDTAATSDKIIAGAANNAPKLGLYYLFTKMGLDGAAAAAIGSVGYDVLIRLTNKGVNPANVNITLQGKEYRILQQKLSQTQSQLQMQQEQSQLQLQQLQQANQSSNRTYGAIPHQQSMAQVNSIDRINAAPSILPAEDYYQRIRRQVYYGQMATDKADSPIYKMYGMR